MDTRLLTAFLQVVRSGSFTAAASELDQDPSSVSRAVAALEAQIGTRLFQRSTRRIALTDAGRRFAVRVEPILAELSQAREEAATGNAEPEGPLRLGASVAFGQACIVPLLPEIRARFPRIALDLRLTDTNSDLVAEQIDLAVRLAPAVRGDMVVTRLMTTRYRACASPEHLRRLPVPAGPQHLTDHPCLCFDLPDFRATWRFRDADGEEEQVAIQPAMTISGALALHAATRLGLGVALLPDWLIGDDLATGQLIDLWPDREATATSFDTAAWLVYPSRSFLPRRTRVMIDFLRERLGRPDQ
jgi:DNA-binding transcriptional LysR family regulator